MSATVAYKLSSAFPYTVPERLALLPDDIRQSDGSFRIRGMTTGRVLTHSSALLVGAIASMEWNRGLLDAVSVDEILARGGPQWGENILRKIDGDLNPDLLVRVRVNNEEVDQAVTLCTQREKEGLAVNDGIDRIRRAYREHGLAWGIMTEDHLDFHRVSTASWLCCAVERGAPAVALQAVRKSLDQTGKEVSLHDILCRAATLAGVAPATATDAYGCLIANRQVAFDIEGGLIMTANRLGSRGERPCGVRDSWLCEIQPISVELPGSAIPLGTVRHAAPGDIGFRRRDRSTRWARDRRRWPRLEWLG